MNWRLTVEYDGRAFCGWQRQAGDRTVQETLEVALSKLFGGERIVLHGSGRTDSGVHALGQVASFRAERAREPERVRWGLNTLLPPDVSVIEAQPAPDGFHARFSARGKTYRYLVLDRPDRSPFWAGRAWHTRTPLDWSAVEVGLAHFVGKHDFRAFRGPNCERRNPVRTIESADHRVLPDGLHAIEFRGPGFLRYQVRIMVGTLIEVGLGKRDPAQISAALLSGRRADAGRTAFPEGLYLVEVRYPEATEEVPDEPDTSSEAPGGEDEED